jgi:hypothetical protein
MVKIIINKKKVSIVQNAKKIYPSLENLEVKPSGHQQIFNHPNSYGYDQVIVEAVASDTLNIIPSIEEQQFVGLYGTVNVEGLKVPVEQWYKKTIEYWDDTIITDLTQEELEALENMKTTATRDLILEYDDEVLDIDFTIENNDLVVTNNVTGLDFNINNNGELEAIY